MPLREHLKEPLSSWKASLRRKVSPHAQTQDATNHEPSQPDGPVAVDHQVKDDRASDAAIFQPQKRSPHEVSEYDDFWDRAYQELKAKDEKLWIKFEACLAHDEKGSASTTQQSIEIEAAAIASSEEPRNVQMRALLQAKIKDDEAALWRLQIGGSDLVLRDLVDKAVKIVAFAKDFVSAAVSSEPHAALAWTGVCVLLPLILQPSEQRAAMIAGLEEISGHIQYYNAVAVAYRKESLLSIPPEIRIEFECKIVALFTSILEYQARTVIQLSAHFPKKAFGSTKETWNSALDHIRSAHRSCYELMRIVDKVQLQASLDQQADRITSLKDGLLKQFQDLSQNTQQTLNIVQDQERSHSKERLQHWLGAMDQSNFQAAHCSSKSRGAGTGEWLLESKAFKEWYNGVAPYLWLNGTVGCGKTVLCSSIIHHIQSLGVSEGSSRRCELAYAYISWDDQTTHDLGTLVRAFLAQLSGNATISAQITKLYKESQRRVLNRDDITNCLMSAVRQLSADDSTNDGSDQGMKQTCIILVLDALDEVPFGPLRDDLLDLLLQLAELRSPKLRILVSSRKDPDIEERLILEAKWRNLPIESRLVSEDIGRFVRSQLAQHRLLKTQSVEIKDLITDGIVDLSDGMFRLAFLQMQEFVRLNQSQLRKQDVKIILKDLPREIYDGYKRILRRIPKTLIKECVSALKCLAFSRRPLFIEEVVDACATDPAASVYFTQDRRLHPRDILANLADLVTVEPYPGAGNEPFAHGIHILSLAHFSVREFLSLKLPSDDDVGVILHTLQPQTAHGFLAQICLAYIAQYTCTDNMEPGSFFFLDYAWHFWAAHTVTTLSSGNAPEMNRLTFKLFNSTAFPIVYPREGPENASEEFDLSQGCFEFVTGFLTKERLASVCIALQTLNLAARTSNADSADEPDFATAKPYLIKESLPEEPRAMRLVVLHPPGDGDLDSMVDCSTCVETLNNNPSYTAIAYVWYDLSFPNPSLLRVNGALCELGGGVVAAMKRLRFPNASRVVWIDAICISMQDMAERSAQVLLMSDIYRHASQVVMWLGEEDETSSSAMEVLRENVVDLTPLQSEAIDLLFQRRLWSRVWIVQEIISAKRLFMRCGPHQADFDNLGPIDSYASQQPVYPQVVRFREPRAAAVAVQQLRHEYQRGARLELQDLLRRLRYHECSQPSDRIYAMLNLLPQGSLDSDLLKVDYERSPRAVFTRAAAYIMKRANSLDLLCLASQNLYVNDEIPYMPSWVPDFGQPMIYASWDPQPFNADGGHFRPLCIDFLLERQALLVKGFLVDRIHTIFQKDTTPCDRATRLEFVALERATGLKHGRSGAAYWTRKGSRGIGPFCTQVGDSVAILAGGSVPFILREVPLPREERIVWTLVGASYVPGFMDGSLARDFTGDLMQFEIR